MSRALRALGRRALAWAVETEGSTRSAALLRIGLAALLWTRWGRDLQLFRDLSPAGLALAPVFYGATVLMFFGVASRAATAVAGICALTLVYGGEVIAGSNWQHHHTVLLAYATVLCALTPCDRSYSLDRWWAVRRAHRAGRPAPAERGNLWGLRLIACQVSAVYFWSAYDKTNLAFLSGDRLGLLMRWQLLGSSPPELAGFAGIMLVLGVGTVALEYALAVGLLMARTRRWLILPGMAMHGLFQLVLPLRTFTPTMWLLYLAYLDADSVHARIEELHGGARA